MSRSNNQRFNTEEKSYWSQVTGELTVYVEKSDRRIGLIDGRRPWIRKTRYPKHSSKSYMSGPPRWWWKEQHAKVRQIHRQMMIHEEDPALPDEKDLINLWEWY